jgi:CHAT domain-containing protein/tetratricopeptide (TPR) repeat protein
VNDQPKNRVDILLRWCAILRRCDAAMLRYLSGCDDEDIRALLGQGWLHPTEGDPASYTLDDELCREILMQLREQRARDEIDLHAHALHYFISRMLPPAVPTGQQVIEANCLYHLGALHDLFIEYMEWDAIIPYIETVRNSASGYPRMGPWLEFYAAYTTLRSGHAAEGHRQLEALCSRLDLEPQLRLRALHACHIGYIELSRYDEALHVLADGLVLARSLGDRARESYLLLSISQIYNDLDDNRRALEYSEQSLQLAKASGAIYREAQALYEVGKDAMYLGDWERALIALDQSTTIYTRLGMPHRLMMPLWAQGMTYQINGDDALSEQAYRQALAIAQSAEHLNPPTAMDTLMQLGLLYQTQAHDAEALNALSRAIDIAEQHDFRHWRPILLGMQARLLQRRGSIAEAGVLYRAAIKGVETIRSQIEIEAIQISLFGTSQYIYESLVLFCLEHETRAAAFAYAEQARARAFLDLLARQSPELYGAADQPTVTLMEVQARLGAGELLLEYFTTGVLPREDHWLTRIPQHNARLRDAVVPTRNIILFAITHDWHDAYEIPVDPNMLYPSRHSDDPILDMLRIDGVARWLYDRLLAPVEHMLSQCHQVYLIPHGPLHYIPFTALRRADSRYLLDADGPAVSFAPSATILLRNCLNRPVRGVGRALAIGYNGAEGNHLDHAELEAQIVAQMVGGEHKTGIESKSQELIAAGGELRWLHIAGHAIYDPDVAYTFGLQLGRDDILDATTVMRDLKLRTDLVTLSSCMSGFSRVVSGDELFGLQRAFLYAGTPTVVCTLAKTRDTVAILVMEQFYTYLHQGTTAAQSLRNALITIRRMRRNEVNSALVRFGYGALPTTVLSQDDDCPFDKPEYWAPFVLIGRP